MSPGGTDASTSIMLRLKTIMMGSGNDQGTAVADSDDHPDRRDVGALLGRSRHGAWDLGLHGQSVTGRQAAIAVGAAAVFRAHQCSGKSHHFCAASAHPRCAGLLDSRY